MGGSVSLAGLKSTLCGEKGLARFGLARLSVSKVKNVKYFCVRQRVFEGARRLCVHKTRAVEGVECVVLTEASYQNGHFIHHSCVEVLLFTTGHRVSLHCVHAQNSAVFFLSLCFSRSFEWSAAL